MTEAVPAPPNVEADKARPWKMVAAAVAAFLSTFLLAYGTELPAWAVALITAVLAGLAVFVTPNPLILTNKVR